MESQFQTLINACHCERSEAIFLKKLLTGIASAKTPRPIKYWPKASAVKRHLTGRAMTGYADSMPAKRSSFIKYQLIICQPCQRQG
jgi:hypothetical protein